MQVQGCFAFQFRQFVQSLYKESSGQLRNEIDDLLAGDLDGFDRWYILDTMLEAGIDVPLFATERIAV